MDKEDEAFFCLKALQRLSNDACPPALMAQRYALCVSLFRSLLRASRPRLLHLVLQPLACPSNQQA
jgi:hypothetical protein